jgi:3'-5' exonuclease
MANIYFDIETLPSDDAGIIADIAAGIKPPGNLKKAETIEAWERDEKPLAIVEAVKKTGLDGTFGRICCIGYASDDNPVECAYGDDEADNLHRFFAWLRDAAKISDYTDRQSAVFVGHNILSFDLRFLWQRCVVNGIRPPAFIPFNAKPWDGKVFDTMMAWNPERERKISMDKLCRALGVPSPKSDLDGSKVAEYWQAGKHNEVAAYCMADVEAVRKCHKRMMFS